MISKLSAKFGEIEIETKVDEKHKVDKMYEDCVKDGITAVKASYSSNYSKDFFEVSLGTFPPKTKAQITFVYYQTLTVEDMSYRFAIPLVYVPRYFFTNMKP